MASMINYPDGDSPSLISWRTMIQDLEVFTRGLLLISIANINAPGAPRILAGSMLDINGSKYKCTWEENISGTEVTDVQSYIYAVANGNTASFQYSAAEPQWDPAKGGWYNGNNRAVVKLFITGGEYNNKVILDSYNAMFAVNTKQPLSDTTIGGITFKGSTASGVSVSISASYTSKKPFAGFKFLPPGVYRYELKGGNGGNGGAAGSMPANNEGYEGVDGADGGPGEEISGIFFHHGGNIQGKVGADGGDGGKGGNGHVVAPTTSGGTPTFFKAGNGGDGGSGMDSILGGIVARGGESGPGGGYGRGGNGSDGYSAGSAGGGLKGSSSGYARLSQVG